MGPHAAMMGSEAANNLPAIFLSLTIKVSLRHDQNANGWQLALPSSAPIARHTSLRTTFPPTTAIEFAVVVAATAAPSPARLVAVMLCSS